MRLPKVGDRYFTCTSYTDDKGKVVVEVSEWSVAYRRHLLVFSHMSDPKRSLKVDSSIWKDSNVHESCFKKTPAKAVRFERIRLLRDRRNTKKQLAEVNSLIRKQLTIEMEESKEPLGDKVEKALAKKDEDNP